MYGAFFWLFLNQKTTTMKKYIALLSLFAITISCNENSKTATQDEAEVTFTPTTEAEKIAYANGIENWDKVTQLDFTFNVDRGGNTVAKRSWSWKPKQNEVTMTAASDTVTYNRASVDSTSMAADQGFINDKYWLLAPYQILWDEGTTVTVNDSVMSPLSRKRSHKLTLLYGDEGGYTPGDAYDFYYGDDYRITEWVFRKANASEPSMITTFEGYEDINGLQIATDHKSEDGSFRLYFTDVKAYN